MKWFKELWASHFGRPKRPAELFVHEARAKLELRSVTVLTEADWPEMREVDFRERVIAAVDRDLFARFHLQMNGWIFVAQKR